MAAPVIPHVSVEGVVPNLATKVLLFLSSYAPLLVILGMRNSFGHTKIAIALFVVAAISVVALVIFLAVARSLAPHEITVQQATSKDSEAMSYVITYLLPFLGFDSNDGSDQISLAIFLFMLATLYISSNLIHMNPMLIWFRYRMLEIDSADGKRSILLTKKAYIRPDTKLSVVPLSESIYLEK